MAYNCAAEMSASAPPDRTCRASGPDPCGGARGGGGARRVGRAAHRPALRAADPAWPPVCCPVGGVSGRHTPRVAAPCARLSAPGAVERAAASARRVRLAGPALRLAGGRLWQPAQGVARRTGGGGAAACGASGGADFPPTLPDAGGQASAGTRARAAAEQAIGIARGRPSADEGFVLPMADAVGCRRGRSGEPGGTRAVGGFALAARRRKMWRRGFPTSPQPSPPRGGEGAAAEPLLAARGGRRGSAGRGGRRRACVAHSRAYSF